MRHLSFLGGVLAITSLSLLFSSCEKTIDTEYANRQETGMLGDKPCKDCIGEYLGFHSQDGDPTMTYSVAASPFFFWRGGKYDCPTHEVTDACKQHFLGTDFSDTKFFVVSASGGVPIVMTKSGAVGVNDGYIDVGETLTVELSPCMNGHWIDSFNLIFNGNNDAGFIDLYHGANLVLTVPYSKALCHPYPEMIQNYAQNYPVKWAATSPSERFNKMVIRQTAGRNHWMGFHRNLHPNDPDKPYPHFDANWWHLNKEK